MLIVFIIIQLTFEVLWLRSYSIELMTNSFLTFKPIYNNKQPHFTGWPNFLVGEPGPLGPLAGYVPGTKYFQIFQIFPGPETFFKYFLKHLKHLNISNI